ncbi:excalibur calcium-binding domain-containing protein [Actinoplanes sp. HUAS TT8]|uniref:excalibur calcium-binding domain-containing protein n=1 Tax=Actinoplanes sp. HUAS TT8 TaxID=3447453 RepID=UPI003F51EA7C
MSLPPPQDPWAVPSDTPHPGMPGPPVRPGPAYPPGPGQAYPPTTAMPGPAYPPTATGQPRPPAPKKKLTLDKVMLGVVGISAIVACGVSILAPDSTKPATTNAAASETPSVVVTTEKVAASAPPVAVTQSARPTVTTTAPATRTAKPTPVRTTVKPVYYTNCDAVFDAGESDLRKSDPGYRKALDRDGDGIACESDGTDEEPVVDDEPDTGGTDPRFSTCAAAKKAGYGPYTEGEDPEYDWYQDRDKDGVVCE